MTGAIPHGGTGGTGGGDGSDASDDQELLRLLDDGNGWLRATLCTLARRGTRLRVTQPERAARLTEALRPWPWYKGGQFLFDLMEWEDFMVDGPAPPLVPTTLTGATWQRLSTVLGDLRGLIDAGGPVLDDLARAPIAEMAGSLGAELLADDGPLPPLDPGLYLYRDVVLGVVVSAGPSLRARRLARELPDQPAAPPG